MRIIKTLLGAAAAIALAACGASPVAGHGSPARTPTSSKGVARVGAPATTRPATRAAQPKPKPRAKSKPRPKPTKPRPRATTAIAALPLGGTKIFPEYRVVAYYGAPGNAGLGILGAGSAEHAAKAIERQAAAYREFGRKVQPAMELLATVAQGSPGPDHDYSAAVSASAVAAYLAVAKRHHMLLILDFQPGRGSFLPQVKQFRRFLDDPWVGVALDPEWKMGPHQVPATVIGSASASADSINDVSSYLAGIVRSEHLPQKLFVIHQFTLRMLPDRNRIATHPELASVLHADGHGGIAVKEAVYHQLAFPPAFCAGFKLFVHDDPKLMTPAQVMALQRRPDLITYE